VEALRRKHVLPPGLTLYGGLNALLNKKKVATGGLDFTRGCAHTAGSYTLSPDREQTTGHAMMRAEPFTVVVSPVGDFGGNSHRYYGGCVYAALTGVRRHANL